MAELILQRGPVEYRLIDGDDRLPALVLLHEGLGCVGMWQRFPNDLARVTGRKVLAYSRHGYGASGPARLPRSTGYLHDEAQGPLPELLDRLSIHAPVLIGHSDGASIALIHAARYPVSGLVLMAPHVFVEPTTLAGIRAAAESFERGDLAARLAVFHDEPETTFRGWCAVWRSREFRDWNIEDVLPAVRCPVQLIQGCDDKYGTTHQLDAIQNGLGDPVRRLELPDCGHSPHLQRPGPVLRAITDFLSQRTPEVHP